jgi:uncharacterized repeat protein (TIGR01451 family)
MSIFQFHKNLSLQPSVNSKGTAKTYSAIASLLTRIVAKTSLGALAVLGVALPAAAEGSYQLGDPYQALFEYDSPYENISAVGLTRINRPIYVDIQSTGEVINVSACGTVFDDDWEVDIYYVGSDLADFSGTRTSYPPASGTLVFGQSGAAGTSDTNYRSQGSFGTSSNNASCNTYSQLTSIATSGGGRPIKYTTTQAGVYEIRLYNRNSTLTNINTVLRQFDVSVTPNTTTAPNPATNSGRLWSFLWGLNADDTGSVFDNATDANLYIRVPGGFPGTNYVWQLDLNDFAGYIYELVANQLGVDSPNASGNAVAGLSVPISGNSVSPKYRQYLSYPATVNPEPSAASVVTIQNFRFEDNQGVDNTITPSVTTGVQDSGNFKFTTNATGTYAIIIDVDNDADPNNGFNPDGVYGAGDVFLRGQTNANNEVTVFWNGKTNLGTNLPVGTYQARLQAIVGEYHFIAGDVENSGPTSFGLTINKAISGASTSQTEVYWDDKTGLGNPSGATTTLPSGTLGGRHTWGTTPSGGNFGGNSNTFGNTRYIDTYVYGKFTVAQTQVIIVDGDTNDYGDAPDTYGTNRDATVGGNPASHILKNTLYLGTVATDAETDGQPSANADGDDSTTNGSDDEDGVSSFNTLTTASTSYSASVKVNNTTGKNAYLIGWIDFNRNGTFEASEGVAQTIANNTNGNVTLNWMSLSGIKSGKTYARFRLNQDPMTASSPTGFGSSGEVEDYSLTITSTKLLLVKRITAINADSEKNPNDNTPLNVFVNDTGTTDDDNANWPTAKNTYLRGAINGGIVKPGDEVEYTIYFLNTVAPATNVTICDPVPANQTFVLTTYSASSGIGFLNSTTTPIPTTPTGLTNANDADKGRYYVANDASTPTVCKKFDTTGALIASGPAANTDGAIVVEVVKGATQLPASTGAGNPANSYGFVRFRAKVN